MRNQKGLTQEDTKFINCSCRSIAKCESHGISETELRHQIYMLGLYTFRNFHRAGLPVDFKHPGLNQPAKVWSDVQHTFVDERELVAA